MGFENKFLSGLTVGISISESPDIGKYGLGHMHLQDVMVESARYLLAAGATIAYGGDVRYDPEFNFVEILFKLARNHNKENKEPSEKILNYVAYPIYTTIDEEKRANLYKVATFKEIVPPEELKGDPESVLKSRTVHDRYIWARSLTLMREKMNEDIDARVILGGKMQNYRGKYPGLIEEAYLALKNNNPIYIIGAFGGCGRAIIQALKGKEVEGLSESYQLKNSDYESLYHYYNQQAKDVAGLDPIDYSMLQEFFREKGVESLDNGLSREENETLFDTSDVAEIISLLLKGLKNIRED